MNINVNLGAVVYHGTFHVLPGTIPLIFGMSFLGEVSPKIDWNARNVLVKGKKLKVVNLAKTRVS